MQPIHAVADRELADRYWPKVAAHSYAWGALARSGARLAFRSDAPVETADPLAGIEGGTAGAHGGPARRHRSRDRLAPEGRLASRARRVARGRASRLHVRGCLRGRD